MDLKKEASVRTWWRADELTESALLGGAAAGRVIETTCDGLGIRADWPIVGHETR